MRTLSRFASLALLSSLLLVPAAEAKTRIYVRIGPPPLVVERNVPAPSRNHVWVPGYHRWDGSRYVWVGGEWRRPPHRNAQWVAGSWEHGRRGYYWSEGHWREGHRHR